MISDQDILSQPTFCVSCDRQPPTWNDQYCASCRARQQRRHRLVRWFDIWVRWILTSLIESMLGVGIGASVLMAIAGTQFQQWTITGLVVVAIIVSIFAVLTGAVQGFFMRQPIRHWRLWAFAAGGEIFLLCLLSFCGALAIGRVVGLTTAAAAIAGIVIAAVQSAILKPQVPQVLLWFSLSTITWVIASAAAVTVELQLQDPVLGVVWSIAVGRLVYGLFSGAAIAWLIERSEQHIQPNSAYSVSNWF